ncbi:MAG: 1,4-alpha-glucan branching protein GlgB [Verrucomicrobia bacterium]|nr:1,4-alpha-glucan branching protein GlgB [Verrucomicrobiota bacterium]MBS0636419.1 1,4-alpha-glucan branching protein GlgB [Verrucomicrobiota bacterium]
MPIQLLAEKLLYTSRHDPHSFLGLHPYDDTHKVIRIYRPGACSLHLEVRGKVVEATHVHESGLFECIVPKNLAYNEYRVYHQNGTLMNDPYAFWPTFSELDQYLFGKGVHYSLHRQMGGRLCHHQGVDGAKFTVWAPSAKSVSLVGDFNHWDGRTNPMRSLGGCGVWELFVPGLKAGEKYKFEVHTQAGELFIKADPYALSSELRPRNASVLAEIDRFVWTDEEWVQKRPHLTKNRPISIYEVHLGSWKKKDGQFLNYRELAHELATYCCDMGYTHVELMPLSEHPLDESWGYQVTGFFAVTSRFGTPTDFQYFVNHMHNQGIGVIMDWVPGHFPRDDFSLGNFDGTCLYEHADPKQGLHPHWSTLIFNFGRKEVSNFLIASALVWCDLYHIDGLRVDAVASMLYLDYGREDGCWVPNIYGGKENLDAIEFLKHANSAIHTNYPGVVTFAEESTSFNGVSQPLESGGLGFDFKWNMGWMNDTLRYIEKEPIFRVYHHNDLTFGLLYAFSEHFVLVFSHDEVVHGKKSMLSKMPGDMWQKFANLRLLLSYQMCQPGKKLVFMGTEIGQWNEWYCKAEVEWLLLEYPTHKGLQTCVKELNHLYQNEKALWADDFSPNGFEWVDFRDEKNSVISYVRKGEGQSLLCIHNFTPSYHHEYLLHIRGVKSVEEIFNSDEVRYGGSGKVREPVKILQDKNDAPYALMMSLAPLSTTIYRVHY